MACNTDHISCALAPFRFFYALSTTSASLSRNMLLHSWWYRHYLIITFIGPTLIIGYLFYVEGSHMKVSPFNFNIICIYYTILHFVLMVHPMLISKKMRVQKVIQAIEEIDFKLRFKNLALCKSLRRKIILWLTILIVSHILVHSALLIFVNDAYYLILMSCWLKFVELSMDIELSCLASFSWLLYFRAQWFLSHLDTIVQKNLQSDLNLLLCHRQLHYVLKKINKAWNMQVTFIVYIITFQAMRTLLSIFLHIKDYYIVITASVIVVRYLTVLIPLCIVGQRIANVFDSIHVTANTMKDSLTLSRENVRSGASMCAEGELRVRRLRAMSGLQLDAKLPLRMLASVGSILVFILQLRVDIKTHNL